MENKTLPKFYVITASEIVDTGKLSYTFMRDSKSNIDLCLKYGKFGYVKLEKKSDDYINPFKLMRGEPGAVGDDGIKRWTAFVFKDGYGQIFGAGVDDVEEGLLEFVEDIPTCVLLMQRDIFDTFQAACKSRKLDVIHLEYDGLLKTA